MPKVSETYTGTYLNAAELTPLGQRRHALVHGATVEEIGQDKGAKIVLSLTSAKGLPWPKDVVLNKGNALQMQAAFGDDTDDWLGKPIEIWAENVMFQGKLVPGIKIQPDAYAAGNGTGRGGAISLRGPAAPAALTAAPTAGGPHGPMSAGDLDDEIPF